MQDPQPQTATFGARFFTEWKRLGGTLSGFNYAEIQELRAADRAELVAALRRHDPLISFTALQRIRAAESPEALAGEALRLAPGGANTNFWMMFALLT